MFQFILRPDQANIELYVFYLLLHYRFYVSFDAFDTRPTLVGIEKRYLQYRLEKYRESLIHKVSHLHILNRNQHKAKSVNISTKLSIYK